MKLKLLLSGAVLIGAVAILFAADDSFQGAVVKKPYDALQHGQPTKTNSTQILYHGGPVMNVANTVYAIYYGTFPSTTQPIINDFLTSLSGSNPYGVNNTYNAGGGTPGVPFSYTFTAPSGSQNPSGTVYFDSYSQGAQLGSSSIPKIVAHAIAGGLPANENGVYLVITAPDVKIAGFCNSYCAYHTTSSSISSGKHIRYALIPDPTQKCSGCNGGAALYGDTITPNGDMGADTMTDDIIHELSETVTDPDLNAWYTQGGAENADLCNYVYESSSTQPVQTGTTGGMTYHFNAHLGHRDYLVQLLWKNSGAGFCANN